MPGWLFRGQPSGPEARVRFEDGSLVLKGRITFETVMGLYREIRPYLPEVVSVNLKEVTFMDSAGVALLVECKRLTTREGRELAFLNLPDQAASIARLSNAGGILGVA